MSCGVAAVQPCGRTERKLTAVIQGMLRCPGASSRGVLRSSLVLTLSPPARRRCWRRKSLTCERFVLCVATVVLGCCEDHRVPATSVYRAPQPLADPCGGLWQELKVKQDDVAQAIQAQRQAEASFRDATARSEHAHNRAEAELRAQV